MVLLAGTFPEEQRTRIYALINRHIETAVNEGWPAMAQRRASLSIMPTALIEALHETLALKPADDSQRAAQSEMIKALHIAHRHQPSSVAHLRAKFPSDRNS